MQIRNRNEFYAFLINGCMYNIFCFFSDIWVLTEITQNTALVGARRVWGRESCHSVTLSISFINKLNMLNGTGRAGFYSSICRFSQKVHFILDVVVFVLF